MFIAAVKVLVFVPSSEYVCRSRATRRLLQLLHIERIVLRHIPRRERPPHILMGALFVCVYTMCLKLRNASFSRFKEERWTVFDIWTKRNFK